MRFSYKFAFASLALILSLSLAKAELPEHLNGITLTAINKLNQSSEAIQNFSKPVIVRIVFDENIRPRVYRSAVEEISEHAFVMGEILDSLYVKDYNPRRYKKRAKNYMNSFSNQVDIWEIGNEVNGEWLGKTKQVVKKVSSAYDLAEERSLTTALTLYYNSHCFEKEKNEIFRWSEENIPEGMKAGLDYVFISYYDDDCPGDLPDWQEVFTRLSGIFPNSKLGFGEVGSKIESQKEEFIRRYYSLDVDLDNYVGGYFWWYFKRDMVPHAKPLWSVLDENLR